MTEVEQAVINLLKAALSLAPGVMAAIQAWEQGNVNPYDPVHQQVSDLLDAGRAELEAAKPK